MRTTKIYRLEHEKRKAKEEVSLLENKSLTGFCKVKNFFVSLDEYKYIDSISKYF